MYHTEVPIYAPLYNNAGSTGSAGKIVGSGRLDAFGVISAKFKGAAVAIGVGGLSLGAIISGAAVFATVVTGIAILIIGINAVEGMYGDDIRKALKTEPGNVKKEKT